MTASSTIKSLLLIASTFTVVPLLLSIGVERVPFLKDLARTPSLSLATSASAATALRGTARLVGAPATPPTLAALSTAAHSEPAVARPVIELEPLPPREQRIRLINVNTRERATFALSPRGFVRAEDEAALQDFFRCRRTGRTKSISNEVLVLLGHVARRWPDRAIEVVSGYRAPPYGVPHSRHFRGEAIDLRVRGVRTAKVRDFLWREHHGVGVGYYTAGDFIHVDTRPGEPDTAWSAREEGGQYDYEPRWARRARRARKAQRSVAVATAVGPIPALAAAH